MYTHVHVCVDGLCGILVDSAKEVCLVLMQCSLHESHTGSQPYVHIMYTCIWGGGGGGGGALNVAAPYICPLVCGYVHIHVCFCVCMHGHTMYVGMLSNRSVCVCLVCHIHVHS